jgi:hypothetical protein
MSSASSVAVMVGENDASKSEAESLTGKGQWGLSRGKHGNRRADMQFHQKD